MSTNSTEPPMLTTEEVAALFQISRSTAYRLKKKDSWPHHQFGEREIRFSAEDVKAIQAMYRKQPAPDPRSAPRIGSAHKRGPQIGTRAGRKAS
ncbi:helix-turn-helix transcriptional regulator [Paenarthrobacter sp. NPDC057355]|uniref:helix-turn-helix transcriptional regulator n=1 Tax=Paenarthrobacter sp. NPDC057355 TaxID=3346105 RepID=UPI0036409C44